MERQDAYVILAIPVPSRLSPSWTLCPFLRTSDVLSRDHVPADPKPRSTLTESLPNGDHPKLSLLLFCFYIHSRPCTASDCYIIRHNYFSPISSLQLCIMKTGLGHPQDANINAFLRHTSLFEKHSITTE